MVIGLLFNQAIIHAMFLMFSSVLLNSYIFVISSFLASINLLY